MAEIKLSPCPFCGGRAALYADNGIKVICTKCGASTKPLKDALSARGVAGNATEAVIKAWNRRATDDET